MVNANQYVADMILLFKKEERKNMNIRVKLGLYLFIQSPPQIFLTPTALFPIQYFSNQYSITLKMFTDAVLYPMLNEYRSFLGQQACNNC